MPAGIRATALNYGLRSDLRGKTRAIWQGIYDTSNDELVREQAGQHLEHIAILDLLDKGVAAYKARMGAYPKKIDDLVSAGILKEIPADPFNVSFSVGDDGKIGVSAEK